ncbi:hypothetical protein P154DRAFT_531119 [Amniculicola lignicola CBS 123094]|uniref:Uncharacterized protein n=1 Tax=Amniculicola lignicola CBS 123094 TaxID=1392246 RepID=A0A6A5WVH3_9PLEO|nr:hypothetical protein P154DRAFT_531119 [Amniculicola lignicola CBS 123094]
MGATSPHSRSSPSGSSLGTGRPRQGNGHSRVTSSQFCSNWRDQDNSPPRQAALSAPSWRQRSPPPPPPPQGNSSPRTAASNWRTGAAPLLPVSTSTSYSDVEPGLIMWLPTEDQFKLDSELLPRLRATNNLGALGHPVMVISKDRSNGKELIKVRTCTTVFRPTSCEFLDNKPPTPEMRTVRLAAGSECFPKRTYISDQFNQNYLVELENLRAHGRNIRVRAEDVKFLCRRDMGRE